MNDYKGYGCPFDEEPTLKIFKEDFDKNCDEIGISSEGYIGSHKIKGSIGISCINNNKDYKIVGLDIDRLMGCGCWSGIIIEIEEEDNETEQELYLRLKQKYEVKK